jgi:hypothetical protein
MMNKKRLTLLLDDKQIRVIKSRAALAGMSGSQWVISQLDLDTAQGDASTDTGTPAAALVPLVDAARERGHDVDATLRTLAGKDPDQEIEEPDPDVDPEPVTAAQGDQKTEIRERDFQILEIEKKYPGPKNAQVRVDELNAAGILKRGKAGEWTITSAKNAILNAKKNLGIK